jgi:hypothetical protein
MILVVTSRLSRTALLESSSISLRVAGDSAAFQLKSRRM